MASLMDMEYAHGMMELNMTDNGKVALDMYMEYTNTLMVVSMMESGITAIGMEKEYSHKLTGQDTKVYLNYVTNKVRG